ncbi:MAG: PEP-CTERM sorting domain-containing protein [Planctomycetes bacterium]|nr:PEP-CTERM sorting domain-containing protein [Planctomycetota bacterium]
MSFTRICDRRFSTRGLVASVVVVAGLCTASAVNAAAFTQGAWSPASGKTLIFRDSASGGGATNAIFGTPGVNERIEVTSGSGGTAMYSNYPNGGIFSGWQNIVGVGAQAAATAEFTAMNTTGTPWFSFKYIDRKNSDGSWPQFMMYLNADDSTGLGNTAKNQINAGSGYPVEVNPWKLANNGAITTAPWNTQYHGFGLEPVTDASADNGLFSSLHHDYGAGTPNFATTGGNQTATLNTSTLGIINRVARVDGSTVEVKVGRLANGKIEFTWTVNGTTYPTWSNDWFNQSGFGNAFAINHVDLGGRQFKGTLTFLDYNYGSNYTTQIPEPASLGLIGLGSLLVMARRRSRS